MNLGTPLKLTVVALTLALSVPAWSSPTIEDFIREPDLRDAELSPDGKHLAMIINRDGQRTVLVRNMEDPDFPIVGAFSEDIVRPSFLHWGNNDRILISLSVPWQISQVRRDKRKKDDFDINDYFVVSRMVAVDKDMKNMVILMEDERRLRRNVSLSRVTNFLSNKPNHVLMTAFRKGKHAQYEVDIVTGEAELVTVGTSRTARFLNDDDGKPLYRFDYNRRSKAIVIYEYQDNDRWQRIDRIYLNKDDEDGIDSNGLIALSSRSLNCLATAR